jgi:hypothetical protein
MLETPGETAMYSCLAIAILAIAFVFFAIGGSAIGWW